MLQEAQASPIFGQLYNVVDTARRRILEAGILDGSELLQQVNAQQFSQAMMQMTLMQMMAGGGGGQGHGSPPAQVGQSNAEAVRTGTAA